VAAGLVYGCGARGLRVGLFEECVDASGGGNFWGVEEGYYVLDAGLVDVQLPESEHVRTNLVFTSPNSFLNIVVSGGTKW